MAEYRGSRLSTAGDLNNWIGRNPPRGCLRGGGDCFKCRIPGECAYTEGTPLVVTVNSNRYNTSGTRRED